MNDNYDILRGVIYINDGQMSDEIFKQWKDETRKSF